MHSNRLFKLFFLFSLFIFINCQSSQEQSFEQLEVALVHWYYKYHPTSASEYNFIKYNNQLEKYDLNSIEEYKADINRFMIELSQIDETKLKHDDLIRYLSINEFLFQKYNNILNFEDHSHNPKYFLESLYNSLLFIISNNNIDMEQKIYFISSRLKLFPNSIHNIKKNLTYYSKYDIEESFNIVLAFEELLNNLHLHISADNKTLDEIDNLILNINKEIKKIKFQFNNINKNNIVDKKEMILNYIKYNKDINFDLDYEFLIQKTHNEMLNISLPIYKVNNDEPVWVDKEDTLNIINVILEEYTTIYPDENEILMNLDKSLNRISIFCNKIPGLKYKEIENYEIINNNHTYLKPNMLYKLWSDKNKTYLFLNKNHYYKNNLENKFNKFELDLYNIANYFPGKYFQNLKTREKENRISNIFIDKYTNAGWGLLSQYILIEEGYGQSENQFFLLIHLKNVLDSILSNMIFVNYYIHGKSKDEIISNVNKLTFYDKKEAEQMLLNVLKEPLNSNFEIIGYLELKEIYLKFSDKKLVNFYTTILENGHIKPNFMKEFKFSDD